MDDASSTLIDTRSGFQAALRQAFAEASTRGCRELWLVDNDFAEWPLGDREVVDQLSQWATSSRRLVLIARHFDDVARRHARWIAWRRTWSHIVSCRVHTEAATGEFPTVLLAPDLISVRLADTVHWRGRWSRQKDEQLRCREQIDALLQRSEEAFPATTTGL